MKPRIATLALSAAAFAAASVAGILSLACATPPSAPSPPPRAPVDPIRNTAIKVIITYQLAYTPRDANGVQDAFAGMVLNRLNADGAADGNTFAIANGEEENFTLNYIIYDNNERYSGTLNFSGWGWGFLAGFNSGQYTFSNAPDTINALTDQAYSWIHDGWHQN